MVFLKTSSMNSENFFYFSITLNPLFIMNKKEQKVPFFAKFLEKQVKNTEAVKGGNASKVTSKLVDQVTTPSKDMAQTMKYPSDSDEGVDM